MWLGLLILLFAQFLGGAISPIVVKLGVREIPPITFTQLRFLIASIVFLPFFLKTSFLLQKRNLKSLIFPSLFFPCNVVFFAIGLQFTTAIMSQILYTFTPLFVVLLEYIFLKKTLTQEKIVGLCCAVIGLGFLFSHSFSSGVFLTFGSPLGNGLVLLASFCWAAYTVVSKRLTKIFSPVTTSFASYIVTFVILFLFTPFELYAHPFSPQHVSRVAIISLFTVGIVNSALMFYLFQVGIKKTSAFTSSLFQYLSPFFAAITAVPIFHEKPTVTLFVGGVLIIIGVFYATAYPHLKRS